MIAKKNEAVSKAVMELAVLSQDEKNRMVFEAREKERMDRLAEKRYYERIATERAERAAERATERAVERATARVKEQEEKRTNLNAIINMMDSLSLTKDQAMNVLKIPDDEKPKYEDLIRENKAVYDADDKE